MTVVGYCDLTTGVTPAQAGAHAWPAKVRMRSRSARISGRQSIDGTPAFRGGLGPRLRGDDVFWEGAIHHALGSSARHLSPLPGACVILRLPLSATGRGWAHSPSSWQRAAPGRRAEWLEIREARWQPFPVKRQQWRGAGDRPSGSRCDGARPGNGKREPEAKVVPRDLKSPARVPKGNPGTVRSQGALQQGSQGDLPESPGASSPPGCRVGTRVPVAPPARPLETDGAWATSA